MHNILIVPAETFPSRHPFLEEVYTRDMTQFKAFFLMRSRSRTAHRTTVANWNKAKVYLLPPDSRRSIVNKFKAYFFDFRYFTLILRIVRKEKINIIQVRDLTFPLVISLFLRLFLRCRVCYQKSHPHEIMKLQQHLRYSYKYPTLKYISEKLENTILNYLLRFCDAIFPITEHMALGLKTNCAIPAHKLYPFGMGISFENLRQVGSKAPISKNHNPMKLIYVGTLAKERKLENMLEAVQLVSDRLAGEQIFLSVVGGKMEQIEYLEKVTRKLRIAGITRFYGFVDRLLVYRLIREHHIGISYFPNRKRYIDASPTKMMEYLGLGIPVIATNCVIEHRNIIKKTGAGLLTRVDANDVADKIYEMIQDINFYKEKAKAACDYMCENYNYQKMRKDLSEIYDGLFRK